VLIRRVQMCTHELAAVSVCTLQPAGMVQLSPLLRTCRAQHTHKVGPPQITTPSHHNQAASSLQLRPVTSKQHAGEGLHTLQRLAQAWPTANSLQTSIADNRLLSTTQLTTTPYLSLSLPLPAIMHINIMTSTILATVLGQTTPRTSPTVPYHWRWLHTVLHDGQQPQPQQHHPAWPGYHMGWAAADRQASTAACSAWPDNAMHAGLGMACDLASPTAATPFITVTAAVIMNGGHQVMT
jgi:hypothetical protein